MADQLELIAEHHVIHNIMFILSNMDSLFALSEGACKEFKLGHEQKRKFSRPGGDFLCANVSTKVFQ